MSAPAPLTVNVPTAYDALPASPVAPTSWLVHGAGTVPPPVGGGADAALTRTLSNVAVFSLVVSWLVTARPMVGVAADSVVDPSASQVAPFADVNALIVEPLRDTFNHTG